MPEDEVKEIEVEVRRNDPPGFVPPQAIEREQRLQMVSRVTVGGIIIVVGCMCIAVAAFIKGEYAVMWSCIVAALVGAGIMHPDILMGKRA